MFTRELARAERLTVHEERAIARTNALATWAEAEPGAAFLYLKNKGSGETDFYLCGVFFRRWADRDFSAAFDFAERQSVGTWREEMFGWLAMIVAQVNPSEASTMIDHDMEAGPVRAETTIAILHRWARTDLARAAAWADSLPQGAFRDRALDEVAGFLSDLPPKQSPN